MRVEEERIERTITIGPDEFVHLVRDGEISNSDVEVKLSNRTLSIMRLGEFIDAYGVEALGVTTE